MELGIFAKTFRRPDARETLTAVQRLGLTCVQFNFACAGLPSMPAAVPAAVVESITRGSRETGVRLAAISGTFNMAHPDAEVRQRGLERLRTVATAASQLGVRVVTLCTGTRDREDMWRRHRDNGSKQAMADLLETMARALATTSDVTLAIEPEPANIIADASTARALLDVLKAGHRLQVILDPANLMTENRPQGDVLEEAFDLLGANLAIAHAKDRLSNGRVCLLGRGAVDFNAYSRLLRSVRFAGPVIMHGFEEAEAAAATAFARTCFRDLPADALP
ncbi:MAG TPA: sugar phosphate isomerase/epimerase [Chthoniobacterales bacterium]